MAPEITRIESVEFAYEIPDMSTDEHGFNLVYTPGESVERKLFALQIHTNTDEGITGEYVGGTSPGAAQVNMFADYLVGKNPLERERHWSEIKRALRKYDRMGIGPVDVALWDFAGKYHDAPVHELLGTYRTRNANYYERAPVHPDAPNTQSPVYAGEYSDMPDTVDDEGCVEVPEGPGLGVEYDWDEIEARATDSVHVCE